MNASFSPAAALYFTAQRYDAALSVENQIAALSLDRILYGVPVDFSGLAMSFLRPLESFIGTF